MTTSREKVLELLAAQRITAAEADTLLTAMGQGRRSVWAWAFNPLERLPSAAAVALSALPLAAQLLLERKGLSFDGALDLHAGGQASSWARAVLDVVAAFPLLALVLWAATLVAKRRARFVDVLGAVGLSRWPMSLAGLLLLPVAAAGVEKQLRPVDFVAVLAVLPLVAWSIAILCLGFRTASGLRGGRLAWTFVLALFVAEGISKALVALG